MNDWQHSDTPACTAVSRALAPAPLYGLTFAMRWTRNGYPESPPPTLPSA
jgi:hypothetical protein